MRIACIGGGPAGLYFAILMKKANPTHDVLVIERNRPHDTFGWGVVFSDATLGNFAAADPESHEEITRSFHHWDDIDIHFKGRKFVSGGHGFCGIGRKKLLNILQDRAEALGVRQQFEADVTDISAYAEYDLIVASDGVNSIVRKTYAEHFKPDIDVRKCRYIWLGTAQKLDAFTFAFEETEWGWFALHAYRFDADTSTFIVETREETWKRAGLDSADQLTSIKFCEKVFAKYLDGNTLMSNARHLRGSAWLNFNRVLCEKWHHKNIVLIGDAAHTAHFSIGSGTKLAMEDAIALARCVSANPNVSQALDTYQQERSTEALKLQSAARNRMEWFENVERYVDLEPEQFAYSLLTGSQRVSHESLRARDSRYLSEVENWFAHRSGVADAATPPMFTPFRMRDLTIPNRVVMSPMAMYSARNGVIDDFYLVHMGARALGGTGLLFTEMTAISPEARITPGCAGIWSDEQVSAWKRVVDFVHSQSASKIGMQLGHAGPKGSTQLGWEAIDEPLSDGNWPLLAASAQPYGPRNQVPKSMSRGDMDLVLNQFVAAAKRAEQAGFDMLELHCAHGYLLSSFLSPLTNLRTDECGGSLANRVRFPVEVFRAIRAVWPSSKPISVRISAHDWAPGGNTPDDAVVIARAFSEAGADMIDVSSGQTTRDARPIYGRMYQTPFSDQIRNDVGIATIAVGNIFEADHINTIIAAGRADLCALARPHLADPFWTIHAAAELKWDGMPWPKQYLSGREQLMRNRDRAAQLVLKA